MKKVSVLGHFAFGRNELNGQTIKTKIVTEELENRFGAEDMLKIDTAGGIKTLLKAPFQVLKALRRGENVLIFPAHNGVRIYAPLLSFFKRFFKDRRIHYVVIGGWLPEFLESRRGLRRSLKGFDGIYVETEMMKKALEKYGFSNTLVVPNCKKLASVCKSEAQYLTGQPYRLCTFSRVMKEKGIETAIKAVERANAELGRKAFALDIYGQVDSCQREWFDALCVGFPDFIRYAGIVPFDRSVEVLKDYFALIFPTYYEGEGFAGTLIDAFSAAVPVIASDWKYNTEIVNEAVGYVFPARDTDALVGILKMVADDPDLLLSKRSVCLDEAEKYAIDKAIVPLLERLR